MLASTRFRVALIAPLFLLVPGTPASAEPDLTPPRPAAIVPAVISAAPAPSATAMETTAAAPAESAVEAAPAKPAVPKGPVITLNADINLTTQQLTVTAHGKVLHVWPISSGRAGYETPRGTFKPQWAAKMHYSKKYDDAPMPHSVFFNGGVATHATYATGMLGRPASHGCVRLSSSAAATFYNLVHKHGFSSTRIVVHGSPRGRGDEVASRRHRDERRGGRMVQRNERPRYAAVDPAYGYAPAYGQPRRVYVMPRGYAPAYGQVRYIPQGYVRY